AGTALCLCAAACARKQVAVAPPPPPPVASAPASAPAPPPAPREQPAPAPVAQNTAPRYPNAAQRARIDELIARIQDAYFDYDKHTLRTDAVSTLNADAK